jgi:hypothetical protein
MAILKYKIFRKSVEREKIMKILSKYNNIRP